MIKSLKLTSSSAAILVAALGYFVDVYDLVLFSVVRVSSLRSLGLSEEDVFSTGILLLNTQMAGMLLGGIAFGILGDRKGRLSVLFGSIILYSLANLANAIVSSTEMYVVLRFIAGVGLAGELGAGITLVAELLPKERRGLGTTIVATVGVMGAIFAAYVARSVDWRTAYFIGGVLGLTLLFLRVSVTESGLFDQVKQSAISRGNITLLLTSPKRLFRYLNCVLVGAPIWFAVGVLVTFCPEIGKALGIAEPLQAGRAVQFCYIGITLGDLASGVLSQLLRSRKKALLFFLLLNAGATWSYLHPTILTAEHFYWLCLPLGFSVGYWAVLITTAAEQFGTNLRATVTTSVPNFIRGSTVLFTLLFESLKTTMGAVHGAGAVAGITLFAAGCALVFLEESFHKDLSFIEE